ncbi:hypothetical protein ACFXG4_12935 [Nocardia sp. NPDC059246]|uniref:hypothetical protein n=1 Tax=unclassified Nocardia TaxID=2637762 RepID=UPI003682E9E0
MSSIRASRSARRIAAGVAGLATTAAVAVLAAPQAAATVDSVAISGTAPYTINTSYTLTANLSGAGIGLLVYWSDNGASLTNGVGIVPWPVGYSHVDWKPTTAGQHMITASQGGNTKTVIVNVTDPSQPGGGGGGAGGGGGTGSAGSALGGLLGGLTGSAGS